jgi:hypothetical protein
MTGITVFAVVLAPSDGTGDHLSDKVGATNDISFLMFLDMLSSGHANAGQFLYRCFRDRQPVQRCRQMQSAHILEENVDSCGETGFFRAPKQQLWMPDLVLPNLEPARRIKDGFYHQILVLRIGIDHTFRFLIASNASGKAAPPPPTPPDPSFPSSSTVSPSPGAKNKFVSTSCCFV